MKYIRMKDGRIIDLTRYDNKTSPVGKAFGLITLIDKKRICDLEIFEKDVIKQAKEIFDRYGKGDFIAIDIYFLGYLQRNGIGLYLNDCSQEINKYEVKENE